MFPGSGSAELLYSRKSDFLNLHIQYSKTILFLILKDIHPCISRLEKLEEDAEIIGENFSLHYTKYAKRPLMNDLPMDYR